MEMQKIKAVFYPSDMMHYTSGTIKSDNFELMLGNLGNSECPDFTNYDILILPAGELTFYDNRAGKISYPEEYYKRKIQFNNFIRDSKKICCFLLQTLSLSEFLKNSTSINEIALQEIIKYDICFNYLHSIKVNIKQCSEIPQEVSCHRDEFSSFLRKWGLGCFGFLFEDNHKHTITKICSISGEIVGFSIDYRIIILPTHFHDGRNLDRFFACLLSTISNFKCASYVDIPDWLSPYLFDCEKPLYLEKLMNEEKIKNIESRLLEYKRYKLALIYSGDDLKMIIKEIFEKGFGINIEEKEEFKEDLWLLDDNDNRVVMLEVKGVVGDLKRSSINQTDTNRERNNLPTDFPAVIIGNTFNRAKSLKEKNKGIHKEIEKHGKKMNISLIRTLDLLDILNQKLKNEITRDTVINILRTTKGWIKSRK